MCRCHDHGMGTNQKQLRLRGKLQGLLLLLVFPFFLGSSTAYAQGVLYFSEDYNTDGLYLLDTTDGSAIHLGHTGVTGTNVGLAPTDSPNMLYGSKFAGVLHIPTDGSGSTHVGEVSIEGLAYDAETVTLYAICNGVFFTIDPSDGLAIDSLAGPLTDAEGLAFCNGGVYGLAYSNLYFYDPPMNSWSFIADTGIAFGRCGLACDPYANVLYAKGSNETNLYRIDTSTGVATLVGDTGIVNGGGLAFVAPLFADGFESGNTNAWSDVTP